MTEGTRPPDPLRHSREVAYGQFDTAIRSRGIFSHAASIIAFPVWRYGFGVDCMQRSGLAKEIRLNRLGFPQNSQEIANAHSLIAQSKERLIEHGDTIRNLKSDLKMINNGNGGLVFGRTLVELDDLAVPLIQAEKAIILQDGKAEQQRVFTGEELMADPGLLLEQEVDAFAREEVFSTLGSKYESVTSSALIKDLLQNNAVKQLLTGWGYFPSLQ